MSIKTATKRLALGVIIALGLGLLSAPSSSAVVNNLSVSLGSSSAAVTLGDTASTTITHTFAHTQEIVESATVRYSCVAPTGATCPAILANQTPTSDTANVMVKPANTQNTWLDISGNVLGQVYSGWTDSSTTSSVASVRSVINIKAMQFVTAGTYTYSFYSVSAPNGLAGSSVVQSSTVTWTITASAASTSATAINKKYLSADAFTGMNNRRLFLSSTDSAVSVSAGTATSPTRVAYAYLVLQNANGDTRVAVGDGFKAVQDSVTVTVSGPGLVTTNNDGSTGAAKSATLSVSNSATLYGTETLSILSDGTAGTMTITYSIGTAVLGTHTVTFLGLGASAALSAADTVTYLGTAGTTSVTFSALVKDSAGNQVKSGTFYVFSSDTSIAGAVPTSTGSASRQTSHQCNSYNSTSFLLECSVVLRDTGTATITLRDSWTVSASSWSSNEVTLDIRGNVARYILFLSIKQLMRREKKQ